MNKPMNVYERKAALIDDNEFQVFNMTVPGCQSFIEEPESWVMKDFEDIYASEFKVQLT